MSSLSQADLSIGERATQQMRVMAPEKVRSISLVQSLDSWMDETDCCTIADANGFYDRRTASAGADRLHLSVRVNLQYVSAAYQTCESDVFLLCGEPTFEHHSDRFGCHLVPFRALRRIHLARDGFGRARCVQFDFRSWCLSGLRARSINASAARRQ
jgi:hypothetical protein